MKNIFLSILFVGICVSPLSLQSQTLGGYNLYGYLTSAVQSNGCNTSYVLGLPNDSIWVNFLANEFMTGEFSIPSIDKLGDDLLLETGFHPDNYTVSLLLSTGVYSAPHNVVMTQWDTLIPSVVWAYVGGSTCYTNTLLAGHYIIPLDYNLDFGLTVNDTVTGIKIIFLSTAGSPDLAGAYIISEQFVGLNEANSGHGISLFPNPFSDMIEFNTGNNTQTEFMLFDMTGRMIMHKKIEENVTVSTAFLAKGMYVYEFRSKNEVLKKGRVVKE